MDAVIYLGIAVNIIGALLLMFYAVRYWQAFKAAGTLTMKKDELRAQWLKRRMIGFGILIAGTIIAVVGCYL